jgi:hypothetical protein
MLGDSITSEAYVYWQGFRESVDKYHRSQGGTTAVTWVNSGWSGAGMLTGALDNCFNASTNYVTYCTQYNPHAMVVFVGLNDVVSGGVWVKADYQAALHNFLGNCLANASNLTAAQIVICAPWVYGDPTGPNDTQLDECRDACSAEAATRGAVFLDMRTARPKDGGYTTDGKHPNARGKAYLSQRLGEAVAIA